MRCLLTMIGYKAICYKAERNLKRGRLSAALATRPQWCVWSRSRGFFKKMLSVTCIDVRQRQQDQQIGNVEVPIPGRLPADPGADVEMPFYEWRQLGLARSVQALERQPVTRKSAVFERTQVPVLDTLINRRRRMAAVAHAQAGAADHVLVTVLHHVARQSCPQQENRAARTVIRMNAGTPDFHKIGAQPRETH